MQLPSFSRWPEMASALLLLYKVCANSATLDINITLRRLPLTLLHCKEVQQALMLINAYSTGNYYTLFCNVDQTTCAIKLVLLAGIKKVPLKWACNGPK